MSTQLSIILVSLLLSAFFSAAELAFISANRLLIAIQQKKEQKWAYIIARFIDRPSLFISAMLIGNTVSLVIYGIYMAQIIEPPLRFVAMEYLKLNEGISLETLVLIMQSVVSTLLVLAVAEFLPKSISLIDPDKFLRVMALPLNLIYRLLYPFVYLIVSLTKIVIIKVLRLSYSESNPVFGLTDLNQYIHNLSQHSEIQTDIDTKIFSNALAFKLAKVRDCMIPRTEIVAVDKADSIEQLTAAFVESGHSKIVVYEDSIDNVVGYCHCLSLFSKPASVEAILSPVMFVPETMLASELLIEFTQEQRSIALVIDEFGGTAGIVTIEDLMEEIFGEIDDEFDEIEDEVQRVDHNTFLVNARLEIDYLNENYQWQLPEGDYDTLGGYILSINGNIPEQGEHIETADYIFAIVSMRDVRIDKVKITFKNPAELSGQIRPVL